MGFSLKFRNTLPTAVANEFEQFFGGLRAFLFAEHKIDGTHGAVTADTLALGRMAGSLTAPDQPMAQVRLGSDQTIPNNTTTQVVWAVPTLTTPQAYSAFDVRRFLSLDDRKTFTPPEPGTYLITVQVRWANGGPAVGTRGVQVFLADGTEFITSFTPGSAVTVTQTFSRVLVWPNESGSQGFSVSVFQNSGGNLDIKTVNNSTWVQIVKLS